MLEWVIRLRNRADRPRNVGVCFVGTGVRTQYGPFPVIYEEPSWFTSQERVRASRDPGFGVASVAAADGLCLKLGVHEGFGMNE